MLSAVSKAAERGRLLVPEQPSRLASVRNVVMLGCARPLEEPAARKYLSHRGQARTSLCKFASPSVWPMFGRDKKYSFDTNGGIRNGRQARKTKD